ncbi:MAG: primosomal protein N' [Verrucomicrobiae bacterium]|nr:primosomal protein N' [Verrucomicrobiae bacterium]
MQRLGRFAFSWRRPGALHREVIARVALDFAVRKEFDYVVPEEWADRVEVGRRVKVPFGHREVLGSVVALVTTSPHTNLRPISKVLGRQAAMSESVIGLARWMAEYYCCPFEVALKSVLPEAVRREEPGWRERLQVRVLPVSGPVPELTARQREILSVVEEWRELPLSELLRLAETTAETVRRLEDKGLVQIRSEVSERDPYGAEEILPTQELALNAGQEGALKEVAEAIGKVPAGGGGETAAGGVAAPVFLLHGVTGSGKTEVYLQAIGRALERGLGAIVLVPEIALTPQTVERFKARFHHGPQRTLVAVLHSHLSAGERHDEWHKIRDGRARIAIGARSAVFAPVEPLGLIVVDEEHEPSYKQEEAPRYHARDVAVMRGRREGAVVVLGSATPSMESYYNARRGKYRLLELPVRADEARMPVVRVVDMRTESRKAKGPPVFSHALHEAILQRLERREQVMLFLNRRGYSTSLQCPKCGYVAGCPNCSVALTYHRQRQRLCCHVCGHEEEAPKACPEAACRNPAIRYAGLGTERLEDALAGAFPQARIGRMDSDTLKRKEDYRRVLTAFRVGKIDILVGTQMIAKGLHFPNVTLVGIVHADLGLHLPDFRAGERTFQLLTQVAGRAGRGDVEGEVFVQAFTPYHPAIQFARQHDYVGFYEQEIEFREQLRYPPVARAALLTLRGRNEEKVRWCAEQVGRVVSEGLSDLGDLIVAGPAPAPLLKAETFYRYQVMLRTRTMARLTALWPSCRERFELPDDIRLTLDVDPVDLM